jgi:hypothetical protein
MSGVSACLISLLLDKLYELPMNSDAVGL